MAFRIKKEIGPIGLALIAAALWGLSGTAAQALFQVYSFPTFGLVAIRCLIASFMIFLLFRPKWPKGAGVRLTKFALLGIIPTQLFYFITIAYSNIVTALLLEYLFLPIVVIYEAAQGKFTLNAARTAMILLTIVGILLVVLGGKTGLMLSVTPIAIATGLVSAFGSAYYTLRGGALSSKYGQWSITGWSFLIVGLLIMIPGALSFSSMPMLVGTSNLLAVTALVLVVAIFGTFIPFALLLRALTAVTGTEVSIAAATEPVWAAIVSFIVFGALLTNLQYFGGALIILAIIILRAITPNGKRANK